MHATTTTLAWLGTAANRTFVLPLVIFFPTSRCHSRCVSCDWWKSTGEDDLSIDEIDAVAETLAGLGTKVVVFSGGEPLVRPDVFEAAERFRRRGIVLHLLTSGIALGPRAADAARLFARVVVSLDAADAGLYARVRGVDGLAALEDGVARLRAANPRLPVSARSTLHRENFHELPRLVAKARGMRLTSISFLAADTESHAFGRQAGDRANDLLLGRDDVRELRTVIDALIRDEAEAFAAGFIAESPARLRRVAQYYAAMLGDEPFPPVACHAPSVSAVIEANGDIRPCFFHRSIGNLRRRPLRALVREELRTFRSDLDMRNDLSCRRCVCSLNVRWSRAPWN